MNVFVPKTVLGILNAYLPAATAGGIPNGGMPMPISRFLTAAATAALLAAAPVLAAPSQQSGSPPPAAVKAPYGVYSSGELAGKSGSQTSTPAEHARTEELNRQMSNGLYASPALLNGQQPGGLKRAEAESRKRAAAYRKSVDAYKKATKRYKAEMQRHREAEKRYQQEVRRYRAQYPNAGKDTGH